MAKNVLMPLALISALILLGGALGGFVIHGNPGGVFTGVGVDSFSALLVCLVCGYFAYCGERARLFAAKRSTE